MGAGGELTRREREVGGIQIEETARMKAAVEEEGLKGGPWRAEVGATGGEWMKMRRWEMGWEQTDVNILECAS